MKFSAFFCLFRGWIFIVCFVQCFGVEGSFKREGKERGEQVLVTAGAQFLLYNSSYPFAQPSWYINDHTFVYGPNGTWHLFGITHTDPADPSEEVNMAHAITTDHIGDFSDAAAWLQGKQPFALGAVSPPETFLWAPYVLFDPQSQIFYMYYCGGGDDRAEFQIRLAISRDLYNWQRKGTLFTGGVDGRDPMVLDLGTTDNPFSYRYVIYYCGTEPDDPSINNVSHVTYCRTSNDLLNWSPIVQVAFEGGYDGNNFGGPTESPFVVRRGSSFYLFTGAWDGSYTQTRVFLSSDPTNFGSVVNGTATQVGAVTSHAPEVIRDLQGDWWLSSAGWGAGGVYLSPLTWYDQCSQPGQQCTTNLPIPTAPLFASPPNWATNVQGPWITTPTAGVQFVSTSGGLVGSNPLDNAFYVSSSSYVPAQATALNCSLRVSLTTFNGNPCSDPTNEWARFGSAAGFVFAVPDPKNPLANATVLNLFTDHQGGFKLFAFPYLPYQIVSLPVVQVDWYSLQIFASPSRIVLLSDGVSIIDYTPPTPISLAGYLGVYLWQATATFQDFFCTWK